MQPGTRHPHCRRQQLVVQASAAGAGAEGGLNDARGSGLSQLAGRVMAGLSQIKINPQLVVSLLQLSLHRHYMAHGSRLHFCSYISCTPLSHAGYSKNLSNPGLLFACAMRPHLMTLAHCAPLLDTATHPTCCTSCQTLHLQLSIAIAMSLGVANRVLYKMALVPMQDYLFFLAQLQNIGRSVGARGCRCVCVCVCVCARSYA